MLGLVVSLLASVVPALPPASLACVDGAPSCDAATTASLWTPAPAPEPGPRLYATPAVIDCRITDVPTVLQTLVGECDGMPRDASYRMSRYPESEDRGVAITPARQSRDAGLPACNGVPPTRGGLTVSSIPPAALFAVPSLLGDGRAAFVPDACFQLRHRARDRLDRPPRV